MVRMCIFDKYIIRIGVPHSKRITPYKRILKLLHAINTREITVLAVRKTSYNSLFRG